MPTIAITGKITDASGVGVEAILVTLQPESEDPASAQVMSGVGILLLPVSVQTDSAGDFSILVEIGFRYRLIIEAIAWSRVFVAPDSDISFHLLGLVPEIESITDYQTDDCVGVMIGDPAPLVDKVILTIKADPISTVRERYRDIRIEVAPTQYGAYVEISTVIELEEGVTFYTAELDGPNTEWYRARYSDGVPTDYSLYSPPQQADGETEELVISVDELKAIYMFGVDLTDDDGNPFPDRMIEHYIKAAVARMEKELDIPITPLELVDELHDHYAQDYGRWGYFQLHKYPIICLREVSFMYPSQSEEVIIDPEWIVLVEAGDSGQIQIVPGQGNIADVLLIPGQLMPLWSGATGRVPGVWRFDYRAGFEVGDVPADVKDAIGMQAAIGLFNIAGDLVAGAGIANTSISIPGLSQSVGTTSSATNAGYGARILQYEKQLKTLIPLLRRFYGKGTRLEVA